MSLVRDFATFMEDEGFGTFGDDLFVGGVPLDAPDTAWWLTMAGGSTAIKSVGGEKIKQYRVNVYYRSESTQEVYDTLQDLEQLVNTGACYELGNYQTVELEATLYSTDQDIDIEERTVGLLEITVTVYDD